MSNEALAKLRVLQVHGLASSWPELVAKARYSEFNPDLFIGTRCLDLIEMNIRHCGNFSDFNRDLVAPAFLSAEQRAIGAIERVVSTRIASFHPSHADANC